MFTAKYKLCDLFGIPLYLDVSLVVLLLLFTIGSGNIFIGLACAVMLLVSIAAHEFGHALTARAFGYQTNDITLSLLGGCASLIALPRKPWQEFLTALAGPLVSFALAGVGLLGLLFSSQVLFFGYLFRINLMLGAFNLLPGFPLDGGRIFRSAMRPFLSRVKATYVAMVVGRIFAIFLAIKGFQYLFTGTGWGVVTLLIAWMIWKEGYREYQLAKMEAGWDYQDYRARVSPPPYGGEGDDCDVDRV